MKDLKDKGELNIQKAHNLLQSILKKVSVHSLYNSMEWLIQVELSPLSDDGYLHIGDKVILVHIPSNTIVSAFMTASQSHEATQLLPGN